MLKLPLLLLLFISCAQRIKVPVNRMISPEAMGRGMEVAYKQSVFSEGKLDFVGGETDNPLNLESVTDPEFYLALGIAPSVDVFFKAPKQSVALLGLKAQLMGAHSKARSLGHKLAFTFAMGANRDKFEGAYDVKIKSQATEISIIHGYRISPWILIYDGISYSKYKFYGEVLNATSSFDSDEYEYAAEGIAGAHIGAEVGGHTFKAKLEYAAQKIEWSHTDSQTFQSLGFSVTAAF